MDGVISEIAEDETKQNLKSASDFTEEYFSVLFEFLENLERIKIDPTDEKDPDDWGTEEFLLVLLGRRRIDRFE